MYNFLIILILKGGKMSVARITTLNFKSKEGADEVEETYKNSAPTEFAEAEQLLEVLVKKYFIKTSQASFAYLFPQYSSPIQYPNSQLLFSCLLVILIPPISLFFK